MTQEPAKDRKALPHVRASAVMNGETGEIVPFKKQG